MSNNQKTASDEPLKYLSIIMSLCLVLQVVLRNLRRVRRKQK